MSRERDFSSTSEYLHLSVRESVQKIAAQEGITLRCWALPDSRFIASGET